MHGSGRFGVGAMKNGYFRSVDKTKIYYETYGSPEKPTIVISDGLGCDRVFFEEFIRYFQDRAYIVIWNYRGHGKSESP
jgi:3-oxoadipate enol-lactonase